MKYQKHFNQILLVLGSKLAELRVKNGYPTISEFSKKYDLPAIQYWRMEKGKANVTLKSLFKVLTIHKITLSEFFCLMLEEEKVV